MCWLQKYIGTFGGDPIKVTMYGIHYFLSMLHDVTYYQSWGESAGAISVSLHMLANGGNNEGLF